MSTIYTTGMSNIVTIAKPKVISNKVIRYIDGIKIPMKVEYDFSEIPLGKHEEVLQYIEKLDRMF